MAQPTTAVFEPREDLGMSVDEIDLAMNRQGYIAHRVMPIVTRNKNEGKFPRVPLEQLLQNLDTRRNPDGTYKRSKMEFADDDYSTEEHGLEAVLDDRTVARYDDIFDAEVYEGNRIENALLAAYEKEVADLLFNATTFSGYTSAITNEWDDLTNATPYTDILTAKKNIRGAFGRRPNALIITWEVFENVRRCDELIDLMKYQGFQDVRPGSINAQALAAALDLEEVIVADSVRNTKEAGVTATLSDFWSNEYALVAYVARTNDPGEACLGRTFMWAEEGAMNGDRLGVIGEMYYEDQRRGDVLRKRTDWGVETLFIEAGWLFSNATT